MKKVLLLSVFLLTGCFKLDSTINKEYEFAKISVAERVI